MTERLPLFPLGAVLFPGLLLPLHIFEDRYRVLVRELVAAEGPREFGVVAIRTGREVGADGVSALHEVGCTAVLQQVAPYDDGRFDVLAVGARRFRLIGTDRSRAYLTGEVEHLDEPLGDSAAVLARGVGAAFVAYRSALLAARGAPEPPSAPELPTDPTVLSYLVAAASVLDLTDEQRLLAAPDTSARLGFELELLRRELRILGRLPSLPGPELLRAGYSVS